MSNNIIYLKKAEGELSLIEYKRADEVVVIPETIEGIQVKQIGMGAFKENENIKEIIIPDTVHTIHDFAFEHCKNLETVKLPKNLKVISNYCFDFCENLKNIELPQSIERIEQCAFRRCISLENINLPENLVGIGEEAFFHCVELKDVKFPQKLKNIDRAGFMSCKNLIEVHLYENIENIGSRAFEYCYNLKKIILESAKVKVGKNAFEVTDHLVEVNFNAIKCLEIKHQPKFLKEYITNWASIDNQKEVLLHISKKKVLQQEILMGDDVEMVNFLIKLKLKIDLVDLNKYIDKSIKEKHTALTAIFLAYKENNFSQELVEDNQAYDEMVELGLAYPTFEKLKEKWKCSKVDGGIRISAYKGSNDKEVIPKQLADGTPILLVAGSGGNAYKGLATIIIEDGIPEIGEKAFYDCKDLMEVLIPPSVQSIGKLAFENCNAMITRI